MGKSCKVLSGSWSTAGGYLKPLLRGIMQNPREIFANFCVHCCAPALRSRAKTLLKVGGFLKAFLGGCLESSSRRSSRVQDMGKFLGVGVDNCLGESWGKSDKALGGSCGSVRGFPRQLSSKNGANPQGGLGRFPVRFVGQCRGKSCNELVGCWRLLRAIWDACLVKLLGSRAKVFGESLLIFARILKRLIRGIAQSSWGDPGLFLRV